MRQKHESEPETMLENDRHIKDGLPHKVLTLLQYCANSNPL